MQLTWAANPESDVAGYKVHYGSSTGYSFSNAVDVGDVTSYTLSGLSVSDTIAVTAYDTQADGTNDRIEGHESWFTDAREPWPGITLSTTSLDFDVVVVGQSGQRTFTIQNDGTADLVVSNIASSSDKYSASPTSFTVSPDSSQIVTVDFNPTTTGTESGNLSITHNASGNPSTVTLTGVGVPSSGTGLKGVIYANTTWGLSGSPYYVIGDVQVPAGITLSIEPGVVIQYTGAYEILVQGTIVANGTDVSLITFTTFTPGVSSGGTILRFANTNLTNSQLSHIKLEYANYAIRVASGSTGTLTVSDVEVDNATVQTDGGTSTSTLILTQAAITESTVKGSYAHGGPIIIQGSTVSDSQIKSDNYARGITVLDSTVTNSPFYLGCCSAKIRIEGSTVTGSSIEGCCGSPVNGPLEVVESQLINTPIDLPNANVSISNSTIECNGTNGVKFGNGSITYSSVIGNNDGVGIEITGYSGYNIGGSVTISNTTITQNSVGIKVTNANVLTIQHNNIVNNTTYNVENRSTKSIDATNNYWGTTDAAQIAATIYDYYDDINYGEVNYSPLLSATFDVPVLGPENPAVSITAQGGTTQDPIFTLALSAGASATEMLISDDHTFPVQFQWESFAATKDFHSDGTKYIYAKFKDASDNESAIAFAKPPRIMYIQKSSTLGGHPVLSQVRIASDLGGSQGGGGSPLNASQARVAANSRQVKTFYRPIGGSNYTELTMSLAEGIYSTWIPGSQTANGIEYYFQVEDADGNVLATLPETNPSTQPYSLSAAALLQEDVTAGQDTAVEFAVGLTVEIPAGTLASDTQLQVASPAAAPDPPEGMTATDINYALSMADGTTSFSQPMTLTFGYADSDVAGMTAADLRAYYLDNGNVKYAGGTVNTTAQTVAFDTNHFTDFFLAEGSLMHPSPVTTGTEGVPITIQASVVNYVPVQSATLYYRVGTGGDWQSLTMSQVGDYYQATIPGGDVTEADLAYYIQASDGSTSATFPSTDPANNPQTINVTLNLSLQVGWNLISIPRDQANTAITTVLSSISGSYDLVYAYDASDATDPWKKYNVNAPSYSNDLTAVDESMGVWVHMTTADTLTVAGSIPTTTNIPLYQGWNLVGYPGIQATAISEALSSADGKYTLVYAYDASDVADPWKKYNVSAPAWANNLSDMRSRWGFWIQATENCTLTISN